MSYYLKKYWGANLAAILLLIMCALQTGNNLLMMQTFQSIIELDLRGFFFWTLILMSSWFVLLWVNGLCELLQGRAIRKMNNAVRQDMTATMLHKSHVEFHGTDTGEYLSWFTNDVNQIEGLAWRPFYQCVACAANVIFSAIALLMLHWSLLAAALVNVAQLLLSFSSTKPYFDKITVHGDSIQNEESGGMPEIRGGITVKDLTFRYDEKPVLSDLSLTFRKGGKYALTGPSGCGKSTLLKLLLGWLPDYGGSIRFDSADAHDFTPSSFRNR